jgi:hypothetical protein
VGVLKIVMPVFWLSDIGRFYSGKTARALLPSADVLAVRLDPGNRAGEPPAFPILMIVLTGCPGFCCDGNLQEKNEFQGLEVI